MTRQLLRQKYPLQTKQCKQVTGFSDENGLRNSFSIFTPKMKTIFHHTQQGLCHTDVVRFENIRLNSIGPEIQPCGTLVWLWEHVCHAVWNNPPDCIESLIWVIPRVIPTNADQARLCMWEKLRIPIIVLSHFVYIRIDKTMENNVNTWTGLEPTTFLFSGDQIHHCFKVLTFSQTLIKHANVCLSIQTDVCLHHCHVSVCACVLTWH